MRSRFRTAVGVALALLLPAVLVACGDDDDGGDGDSTESIVVYSGRDEELVAPLFDQFTEETGIEVEARYGESGEMGSQILTEGSDSPADVFFSQDAGALGAVSLEGLFADVAEDQLALVPEAFSAADGSWVGLSARVRVLAYNPDLVDDPPTAIDDVVSPEYEGMVGYAPTNASWQAFVTGLRVLRGEDGARQWLEDFAAIDPVPFEGNSDIRDAIDAGDLAMGLTNHYYRWELVAELGEDEVVVQNQYFDAGDPGGLVNLAGAGVLANGANPEGGQELIAYLLGTEGQEFFAEATNEYPLIDGVSSSSDLPPLEDLDPPELDLTDLESLAVTVELLEEVGLLTQ